MSDGPAVGLDIAVEIVAPYEHAVELVAVGVLSTEAALGGALAKLDAILEGEVEHFRIRGAVGDVLLRNGRDGIRAPRLLLVHLGAGATFTTASLRAAADRTVRCGAALGARSIGFAPGVRDSGYLAAEGDAIAREVVSGAREAYASVRDGHGVMTFTLEASSAVAASARRALGLTP